MKHNALRVRVISIGILVFAFVLVGKLYMVQIVNSSKYKDRAEHQYVQPSSRIFERGTIYFQNKDGSLYGAASVKSGFTIVLNAKKVVGPEDVYVELNKAMPLDRNIFFSRIAENDPYEELFKKMDEPKAKSIEALKLPGISLIKDKWRFYPGGRIASQVLGFVGYKGDELAGRYGLESYYQDTLKRNVDNAYVNFFAEVFSNIDRVVNEKEDLEGDIVATIEPNVQIFLERALSETNKKYDSEMTAGIIMDPKTGEVYAMGAYPNFDPNSFQTEKNVRVYSNPLVESVYEMGSIIKPLTIAAALDAKAITAKTTYNDKGSVTVDTLTISNSDKTHRGITDMQTVLSKSLNTGVAFAVERMGKETFRDYFYAFGLGEETGIDLPNEVRGLVSSLKSPRDVEYYTASFGQGIAISPIATVRALSALGNGGYLPQPHLVKEIKYKVGFSNKIEPEKGPQVITRETSEEISRMLTEIVDKALKNGQVKLPRYSVAAKTGTAQISQGGGKGYYTDRTLHSFFGYFPSYDPRFIVFLYTIYPKNVSFASETLTDPFFNITKFLINYYEVPPDR